MVEAVKDAAPAPAPVTRAFAQHEVKRTLFEVADAARRFVRAISERGADGYIVTSERELLAAAVDRHDAALVMLGRALLSEGDPAPGDPLAGACAKNLSDGWLCCLPVGHAGPCGVAPSE